MKRELARRKIGQARFFIKRADATPTSDGEAFANFVEAAIVFAQDAVDHFLNEHRQTLDKAKLPEFESWYSTTRQKANHDGLFDFFNRRRNFICHRGPAGIGRHVSVVVYDELMISDSGTLDQALAAARPKPGGRSGTHTVQDFIFAEKKDDSGFDLLDEFLYRLSEIVEEADKRL